MNFFRKDKEKNPILQLFLWHFSQLIHFLINFLAEKPDFRKLRPVLIVARTKRLHAQSLCGPDVHLAIIYKQRLFGRGLLTFQHHAENLLVGLHHATLETQIHLVEIIAERMTLAVKRRTVGPHHHKRIRVRQQTHLIAILPQAHDAVQIALRHIVSIAVPSLVALLHAHFPTRHSAHLGSKLLLRDASSLQVGKHALLHKSIQPLSGILQSYSFEPLPPKSNAIFLIFFGSISYLVIIAANIQKSFELSIFSLNISTIYVKHIRFLHATYRQCLANIYDIFIIHIHYVRCTYRLLTSCGAYVYMVRSLYSHRLHRLGCMSGATRDNVRSNSVECQKLVRCCQHVRNMA